MNFSKPWMIVAVILFLFLCGVGFKVVYLSHHNDFTKVGKHSRVADEPVASSSSANSFSGAKLTNQAVSAPVAEQKSPEHARQRETIDINHLLENAKYPEETKRSLAKLSDAQRWMVIQQLTGITPTANRNNVISIAFLMVAKSDPTRAMEALSAMDNSVFKTNLTKDMINVWSDQSPEAVARWLDGDGSKILGVSQVTEQSASAINKWTKSNPQAAAQFGAQMSPDTTFPSPTSMAVTDAARVWSEQNPEAAFEWAKSLPDSNPRKLEALNGALWGYAGKAPEQAASYVQQLIGSVPDADGLAAAVGAQWTRTDPQAASQWAASITDSAARQVVLKQVADAWTNLDTQSAAHWAATLPESDARGSVWNSVAAAWSFNDPTGLDKWLATLPQGTDRDQAVAAYANQIAKSAPEQALAWTQTFSNTPMYADQVKGILYQWELKNPLAAAKWAAENGMTLPQVKAGGH